MKANVNSSWGETYLKYSPGPGTKGKIKYLFVFGYMHLQGLSNNPSLVHCKVQRKKSPSLEPKNSQYQFDEVD